MWDTPHLPSETGTLYTRACTERQFRKESFVNRNAVKELVPPSHPKDSALRANVKAGEEFLRSEGELSMQGDAYNVHRMPFAVFCIALMFDHAVGLLLGP